MTLRPKADIQEIRKHLQALKKAPWMSSACRWWPDYVFHCTDILNVVSVLRGGELLSRTQVLASNRLQVDIAAPEIIAQTDPERKDDVRLYFRPRTPTQHANEGLRTTEQQQYGTQCPVPVYLLFDAVEVLARLGSLFTEGNVAAGAVPNGNIDALRRIPFQLVYHDTWFDPVEGGTIVFHRNAEVLMQKSLCLRGWT